jgi:hypothetical protein
VRSKGAKMATPIAVFTPTISAEFAEVVVVGTGVRELLLGLLVELPPLLELETPPVPFNLFAFLTNAPKFSQSESFALMAPTPPEPHPHVSKNHIVLFWSAGWIWMVIVVPTVPLTVSRGPE